MYVYVDGRPLYDFLRHNYAEQTITLAIKAERHTNYYHAKWCAYKKQHRLSCVDIAHNAITLRIDLTSRI